MDGRALSDVRFSYVLEGPAQVRFSVSGIWTYSTYSELYRVFKAKSAILRENIPYIKAMYKLLHPKLNWRGVIS